MISSFTDKEWEAGSRLQWASNSNMQSQDQTPPLRPSTRISLKIRDSHYTNNHDSSHLRVLTKSCANPELLKRDCGQGTPGHLDEMHIPVQQVWGRARDSAFLMNNQKMQMVPAQKPYLEYQSAKYLMDKTPL